MGLKTNASKILREKAMRIHDGTEAWFQHYSKTLSDRYLNYVMCTDETPKMFDEWLEG